MGLLEKIGGASMMGFGAYFTANAYHLMEGIAPEWDAGILGMSYKTMMGVALGLTIFSGGLVNFLYEPLSNNEGE